MKFNNLEEYLRHCAAEDVIDHQLRASVGENGVVTFYIHPASTDGDTLDYTVNGDVLIRE